MNPLAIKWANNYHKGFNRLWIVVSIIAFFPAFFHVGANLTYDAPIYELVLTTFVITTLISLIIFGLGHAAFFIVLWIIKGFQDKR